MRHRPSSRYQLADRWGRKRVLVLGWLFGLPVPFMIIAAPGWVIAANDHH